MTPCKHRTCDQLVERGYCDEHRSKHRPVRVGTKVYNSQKWKVRSRAFAVRHPFCNDSECSELGTQIDHIRPIRERPDLVWDESNWQNLCRVHHGRKTAEEVRRG